MMFAKRILLLFGLVAVFGGSDAVAAVIPFSGSGSNGTISPASSQWALTIGSNNLFRGVSVWGVPGLGDGNETWPPGVGNLISFTVTFNGLPTGVAIDQSPDPSPTGADDFTRFHRGDDGIIWIPSFTGTNSVTFDAPIGYSMPPGTQFFVNVAFTAGSVAVVDFTGSWTTDAVAAAPEPATISLMTLALLAPIIASRRLGTGRS